MLLSCLAPVLKTTINYDQTLPFHGIDIVKQCLFFPFHEDENLVYCKNIHGQIVQCGKGRKIREILVPSENPATFPRYKARADKASLSITKYYSFYFLIGAFQVLQANRPLVRRRRLASWPFISAARAKLIVLCGILVQCSGINWFF
ncbi:hypothetical protein TNIN_389021 [Trichonephila inaurata madagascariensis]|uniref:Uncharacterized protein n=1 Tax=Trichonephila inaurata madagascariensis TaxID=2747483 RepID=A0A8X6IND4_9ARAC|nr:hypothetical protein TNIN_389021 [Trichonephila inaurata madagascariensis]